MPRPRRRFATFAFAATVAELFVYVTRVRS